MSYTIPLNQLQVQVPTAEDFQNEFSITSNVRSCTLRARYGDMIVLRLTKVAIYFHKIQIGYYRVSYEL